MQQATLSVVVPNYNHARYLPRALQAILSQTWKAQELIIIDDGSTDDSMSVIQEFAERDSSIRVFRNDRNRGVAYTIGRGLSIASCEYVFFPAADDYPLPGFFERAMRMAERYPQAGIIFGNIIVIAPDGKQLAVDSAPHWDKPLFAEPPEFLRDFLDAQHPANSPSASIIYKRSALSEVGGHRKELGHWSDTFALRAVGLKYGVCFLAEPGAAFTEHPNSFSRVSARDPKHMLDVVARAAWLMRSPQFRDRFPEDHVARWEAGYRHHIIDSHLVSLKAEWKATADKFRYACAHGNALDRIAGAALANLSWVGVRVAEHVAAGALRHYRGDVSCYR